MCAGHGSKRSHAHTSAAQRFLGTASPTRVARWKGPCEQTWGPVLFARWCLGRRGAQPSLPAVASVLAPADACVMKTRAGQALLEHGMSEGLSGWGVPVGWRAPPRPGDCPSPNPHMGSERANWASRGELEKTEVKCRFHGMPILLLPNYLWSRFATAALCSVPVPRPACVGGTRTEGDAVDRLPCEVSPEGPFASSIPPQCLALSLLFPGYRWHPFWGGRFWKGGACLGLKAPSCWSRCVSS